MHLASEMNNITSVSEIICNEEQKAEKRGNKYMK
jgi:hypothetical protein